LATESRCKIEEGAEAVPGRCRVHSSSSWEGIHRNLGAVGIQEVLKLQSGEYPNLTDYEELVWWYRETYHVPFRVQGIHAHLER
jgi:hypothetical protein